MMTFYDYIAQSRKMALPDGQTMLAMAGVGLTVPNEEETKRLLNLDRKRHPAVGRKAHRTMKRLDGHPTPFGGLRSRSGRP